MKGEAEVKDESWVITSALMNSGFKTDTPQLVLPLSLARRLDLWSRALLEGRVQVYGTVAGPTRLYVVSSSIEVSIAEEDFETKPVVVDAVVSDGKREVLISD